jgi:dsDNA-specific endonuclease/ATPase MutS2
MSLSVGSAVAVVGLQTHGRVMEVLPGGRYRVAVGSLTMLCEEAQLETVSHAKKQRRRERDTPAPRPGTPPPSPTRELRQSQSIDLHGMTVPEALAALSDFVDRAIRSGASQVEVIHGISGGRLRVAVRNHLSKLPAVVCAVQDEKNRGVTIAYF